MIRRIEKIQLTNVQSYKQETIVLRKGLSIIQGPTNSGKSSIVRALLWALYGDGSWNSLRRKDTPECKVIVSFDDGSQLERRRSQFVNEFVLIYPTGERQEFHNVGRNNVPLVVQEFLGIPKVMLDRQSYPLLISPQHESQFLIFDSPPSIHRKLGVLTQTEKIEAASMECSKESGRAKTEVSRLSEEVLKLSTKLEEFDIWFPEYEKALVEAQKTLKRLEDLYKKRDLYNQYMIWFQASEEALKVIRQKVKNVDTLNIPLMLGKLDRLRELQTYFEKVLQWKNWYDSWFRRMTNAQNEIKQFDILIENTDSELQKITACPLCQRPL